MDNENIKNNGLILVNKEKGYTSYDVLAILKKTLNVNKIGHTGTLDVNATGLLVCLIGTSTKYQDYFVNNKKIYEAELLLGLATDTEDITGEKIDYENSDEILKKYNNIDKLKNELDKIKNEFIGEYNQVPPMYSNKKINGEKLLNLARKGKIVERKPCNVNISSIVFENNLCRKKINGYDLLSIKMKVECSKGTYIRTLCKNIGEKLNLFSCMGDLCRISTDGFDIKNAHTLNEIKTMVNNNIYDFINIALYNKNEQVVTFGKYDMLHLGHRTIIDKTVELAKQYGYESSVLTFSVNPRILIDKKFDLKNIISKEQKISYLKLYGINNILEFPFNENTKNILGEDFVKNILINQMKAKVIVVGDDCSYGKGGICKANDLIKTCEKYGIKVVVLAKIKIDAVLNKEEIEILQNKNLLINDEDMYISSTLIRKIDEIGEKNIVCKLIGHNIYKNI